MLLNEIFDIDDIDDIEDETEPTEPFSPHFLPGRGRRTGHQRVLVIHAVEPEHGVNFNPALCGVKPSGRSLGWQTTSQEVNCPKCLKKLAEMGL